MAAFSFDTKLINNTEDVEQINNYIENLISKAGRVYQSYNSEGLLESDYEVKGYCIVCGSQCKFDHKLEHLICEDCKKEGKQYYKGDYCHSCGRKNIKLNPKLPLCKNCYYKFLIMKAD